MSNKTAKHVVDLATADDREKAIIECIAALEQLDITPASEQVSQWRAASMTRKLCVQRLEQFLATEQSGTQK
jgi:hypothetical protein